MNRAQLLTQEVIPQGVNVDRENHVVPNVRLLKTESRNKNRYMADAVDDAKSLLEGFAVNDGHQSKAAADSLGVTRNIRIAPDGGLIGDWHYNPHHERIEQYLYQVENTPRQIAFSIEAGKNDFEWNRNGDWREITCIKRLRPTALVPAWNAGTNQTGLFEEQIEEPEKMEIRTKEDLRREFGDLVECCNAEATAPMTQTITDLESQVAARDSQIEQLKAELEAMKAEKETAETDAAKAERENQLTKEANEAGKGEIAEQLMEQLVEMDPAAATSFIDAMAPVKQESRRRRVPSADPKPPAESTPGWLNRMKEARRK